MSIQTHLWDTRFTPKAPKGIAAIPTWILIIVLFGVFLLFFKGFISAIIFGALVIAVVAVWKLEDIRHKLYASIILLVILAVFYISLW